jgi:hypothetical protein
MSRPNPKNLVKVTVETSNGQWVFKKKSSILEFCRDVIETFEPPKPKPKPKPKKKRVIVSKVSSESSSSGTGSGGSSDPEDSPELESQQKSYLPAARRATMDLNYKITKDGSDIEKMAKKMARDVQGHFSDH